MSKLWLLLLILSTSSFAGFEEGMKAYGDKDYLTAIKLLLPFAKQGDAEAQFKVGYMYDMGKGIPLDDVKAVEWYRKAAEQGNAAGQNNLGICYQYGQGVPQDHVEAAKWGRIIRAAGIQPE